MNIKKCGRQWLVEVGKGVSVVVHDSADMPLELWFNGMKCELTTLELMHRGVSVDCTDETAVAWLRDTYGPKSVAVGNIYAAVSHEAEMWATLAANIKSHMDEVTNGDVA